MKTIIPAADRTAGRRGAGRRRTKRFAANPQFHPQQRKINRGTLELAALMAEAVGRGDIAERLRRGGAYRIPTSRKAFAP